MKVIIMGMSFEEGSVPDFGSDRWARLVTAGYDYNEAQAEVNRLLKG